MSKISFFGDLVVRDTTNLTLHNSLDKIVRESEFNVINFEAPVENSNPPIQKSGPNNSQSILAPAWAAENGFNIFSLANNHSYDYGKEGMEATVSCISTSSSKAFLLGVGSFEEAYQPLYLTLSNDIKVCIIVGTHREFGILDNLDLSQGQKGVAWLMHPSIIENILKARKEVDYIYVYAHAGVEFMEQPLPEWRSFFKHLIDIGCDGVICSHPHIPMGWEVYKGKPILYSLGNFCFQKPTGYKLRPNWNNSLCCTFELTKEEAKYTIVPIEYSIENRTLSVSQDAQFLSYLKSTNSVLENNDRYHEYVNSFVISLFPGYMDMLGITKRRKSIVQMLRNIKHKINGKYKKENPLIHTKNALQCESHRWAILRAMELKDI